MADKVLIEVVRGREGPCLTIGDENSGYRLAGPKPWGGGTTAHSFRVDADDLIKKIAEYRKAQASA